MTEIKPFVKWVGGKRQLIMHIEKRLPKKFNSYFEPFVGGGALFMHLKKESAIINDYSEDLINVYKTIKNHPKKLMDKLDEFENNHKSSPNEYYSEIRGMDRLENWNKIDKITKASRFIYLNKACFNGLYRVNQMGYFNVPSNKKEVVKTYDKDNILILSEYLKTNNVQILTGDFEKAVETAKKGDFIFFDPPYDMINGNSFESYTKDGFGVEGQKRLAELFKKLDKKGCYVMLTNHNTPLINELYKDYKIDVIEVKRMINADATKRTGIETIIYNYDVEGL
jgi:DNA adenine methylase